MSCPDKPSLSPRPVVFPADPYPSPSDHDPGAGALHAIDQLCYVRRFLQLWSDEQDWPSPDAVQARLAVIAHQLAVVSSEVAQLGADARAIAARKGGAR